MNNTPRKRVKTPTRVPKAALKSDTGANPALSKPNIDDPLSEPTRHRRVWAAYLARGFTRRQFAEELGTNYHTVNRWDAGAATISLDMLQRASELLKYTMDELCFGRRGPVEAPRVNAAPAAPAAPAIAAPTAAAAPAARAATAVRAALTALAAPAQLVAPAQPAERAGSALHFAIGSVLNESEIRALFGMQRIDPQTRAAFGEHTVSPVGRYQSFTAEYVTAWCAAYAASQSPEVALNAAVNARAVTEAVSNGVSPVTADELRAALRQKQ